MRWFAEIFVVPAQAIRGLMNSFSMCGVKATRRLSETAVYVRLVKFT